MINFESFLYFDSNNKLIIYISFIVLYFAITIFFILVEMKIDIQKRINIIENVKKILIYILIYNFKFIKVSIFIITYRNISQILLMLFVAIYIQKNKVDISEY